MQWERESKTENYLYSLNFGDGDIRVISNVYYVGSEDITGSMAEIGIFELRDPDDLDKGLKRIIRYNFEDGKFSGGSEISWSREEFKLKEKKKRKLKIDSNLVGYLKELPAPVKFSIKDALR